MAKYWLLPVLVLSTAERCRDDWRVNQDCYSGKKCKRPRGPGPWHYLCLETGNLWRLASWSRRLSAGDTRDQGSADGCQELLTLSQGAQIEGYDSKKGQFRCHNNDCLTCTPPCVGAWHWWWGTWRGSGRATWSRGRRSEQRAQGTRAPSSRCRPRSPSSGPGSALSSAALSRV